jgi:predicted amidohydrolase YtcJ
MDDTQPEVEALLIEDGHVTATGSTKEIESLARAEVEVVDLSGRVVLPGFVDGHTHLELTATHLKYALAVMAADHKSLARICRALSTRARETPPDQWVIGRADFGLHLFVEEKRPLLRSDLDAAVLDHPCVVFSGLHTTTLNTRALQVTGLLDGSACVPKGSFLDIETGRATELWSWLPLPTFGPAMVAEAIQDLGRRLWTGQGVTTVAELPFSRDGIRALQMLHKANEMPLRVGLWLHVPRLGSVDELTSLGFETRFGDEWLSLGGMKFFADGAGFDLEGSLLSDQKWTQDDLDEAVLKSHLAGLQVWIHTAPTFEGTELALHALEAALKAHPREDHRHRVEHVGDLAPDQALLQRFRRDGIIPVTTPQFTWSYGDATPDYAATPLATLHRMGFRPPGNSDATGSQPEAINPWHSIRCTQERKTRSGTLIRPEERVSLDAALRMFTKDAAWACHFDDRGVLAPGYLGDCVVLGADPYSMAPDELSAMPTDLTIIGGRMMGRTASSYGTVA